MNDAWGRFRCVKAVRRVKAKTSMIKKGTVPIG